MSQHTIGRPMEILLVEDSLVDARLAIGALDRSDLAHRLTLVRDGEEAMAFLRREGVFVRAPRPDLILLDLLLPKLTGQQVLSRVRSDEELKPIPVVVLTASDDDEDRASCQSLRVDAYITKPVNLDKFLDVVKKLKKFWLHDVILPNVD